MSRPESGTTPARKPLNLILGLLLLGAMISSISSRVLHHQPMNVAYVVLQTALLLYAVSRLLRFANPGAAIATPLRFAALACLIASFLIRSSL